MRINLFKASFLPLGIAIILFLALGSCTRRDLEAPLEDAQVNISFDWSLLSKGDNQPSAMKLYFYGSNGSLIIKDATAEGFKGEIPVDTYQVLVYNTDAIRVDYINMDSYLGAKAYTPTSTKATYLSQPLFSYGTGLEAFTVLPYGTSSATMKPLPFVKKSTIRLTLTGNVSAVASCDCSLSGIAQSLQIATGALQGDEGSISFSPVANATGYESTISFFGRTKSSTNMLGVVLYFKAGGSQVLSVDITSALSKVDIYNPWIEIKLNIEVTGSAEGVFQATLKDWIVENKEIIVV